MTESTIQPQQQTEKPWFRSKTAHILIVLAVLNLLNQVDRRALVTIFPVLQAQWALSDSQLGMVVSFFTFARALVSLPAAWLADRKGLLRVLRPLAFFWGIGVALSGLVSRFSGFVFGAQTRHSAGCVFSGTVYRQCGWCYVCRIYGRTVWMALGVDHPRGSGINNGCFVMGFIKRRRIISAGKSKNYQRFPPFGRIFLFFTITPTRYFYFRRVWCLCIHCVGILAANLFCAVF
jgi:hypothetical protein